MNSYYTNSRPLSFSEMLDVEKEIYADNLIPKKTKPCNILVGNIMQRTILMLHDKTYNMPQNIFTINYHDKLRLVGRKIRSNLHIDKKINAINCSKITASMLLGFIYNTTKDGNSIAIGYHPLTNREKLCIFNDIYSNRLIDIEFPFRYKDFYTKLEKISPSDGWKLNNRKIVYLGYGEEHIRKYTIKYLQANHIISGNEIIFDPACSTGEFLYEIKKHYPDCITIGQDLSKYMVDYAKSYVDKIYHGNSIKPLVPNCYVDLLVLRFLNSEVVSTIMAYRLFNVLLETVKNGGLIFCFGHTPVLLREKYFLRKKLRIIHANAYDEDTGSIFQFYILQK